MSSIKVGTFKYELTVNVEAETLKTLIQGDYNLKAGLFHIRTPGFHKGHNALATEKGMCNS